MWDNKKPEAEASGFCCMRLGTENMSGEILGQKLVARFV